MTTLELFVGFKMLPVLGIIAGSGKLPSELAHIYTSCSGKCYVAALDIDFVSDVASSKKFALGSVGAILEYFNESKVENIIIVGGINRPDLKSLKVDMAGSLLIAQILKKKFLGDDNILRIVSDYVESRGFKIISPRDILKLSNYPSSILSLKSPSNQDCADIELGKKVLLSLGAQDVGQSIIVCDGHVLGIEAAEGTDNLIRRCDLLRKKESGGVLVKMSKSAQDTRLDIPVIGPDTIFFLAKHLFNGVAIEKNEVIIIDPKETNKLLNESKLFLKLV